MAGHNKWTQIKRQKALTDAKRSKIFGKLARQISVQVRLAAGQETAELRAVVEKARQTNVPKDIIERAIKKASAERSMESALYEFYGPGGVAIMIEALSDNKNRTTQEMKHILSENNLSLGAIGSVAWNFNRKEGSWAPKNTVSLSEEDLRLLDKLVDELEENNDIQEVYTNAE